MYSILLFTLHCDQSQHSCPFRNQFLNGDLTNPETGDEGVHVCLCRAEGVLAGHHHRVFHQVVIGCCGFIADQGRVALPVCQEPPRIGDAVLKRACLSASGAAFSNRAPAVSRARRAFWMARSSWETETGALLSGHSRMRRGAGRVCGQETGSLASNQFVTYLEPAPRIIVLYELPHPIPNAIMAFHRNRRTQPHVPLFLCYKVPGQKKTSMDEVLTKTLQQENGYGILQPMAAKNESPCARNGRKGRGLRFFQRGTAIQLREVENLAGRRGGQVPARRGGRKVPDRPGNDRPSAMETPLR